jgi:opacity protein-like surface antigen
MARASIKTRPFVEERIPQVATSHAMPSPRTSSTHESDTHTTLASASSPWAKVITLSGGPAWSKNNTSQTFYLQPDIEKTYAAKSTTSTIGTGELFLGLQRPINHRVEGQLGIALAGGGNVNFNGNVWEDADPNFNNYTYAYRLNHMHVALKGKLIGVTETSIRPYVSASLGAGFNHAYKFSINPKIFPEVPAPAFGNNTESAFTYTLGLGIQKIIDTHWQAGVGYEFADWGQYRLARAPGQTLNGGLSLNHLYINELLFNVTYVI